MKIKSCSEKETKEFAKDLAKKFTQGGVISLKGELGAGKTTFVQGLAKGLNIKGRVISPTFILIREYPLPDNNKGKFYHVDLYRINQVTEAENIGLKEIIDNPFNLVVIEWPEKISSQLPANTTSIVIEKTPQNCREIKVD